MQSIYRLRACMTIFRMPGLRHERTSCESKTHLCWEEGGIVKGNHSKS